MSSQIQKENGHSPIAHATLEGLCRASFTNSEHRIIHAVIRMTWGWSRKDAAISYTEFESLTGLSRNMVHRSVRSLAEAGVLVVVQGSTGSSPAVYRLQKDPRRWGRYAVSVNSLVPLQGDTLQGDTLQGDTLQDNASVPPQGNKRIGEVVAAPAPTPRLKQKARDKRDKSLLTGRRKGQAHTPEFDAAWGLYPKRAGDNPKAKAFKAWNGSLSRGATPEQLTTATKHYADYCQRKGKVGTEYVKQAATFYGPDEPWRDYLTPAQAARSSSRNPMLVPWTPCTPEELEAQNAPTRSLVDFRKRKEQGAA
jgi:phage replication O-like protein O